MSLDRPVVFPLRPILRNDTGAACCTCVLGPDCGRIGKHPAVLWGGLEEGSAVPKPEPGAGVGIKCGRRPKGSGIVVVDLDGPDALDYWDSCGGTWDTYTVRTGRAEGGLQLYFKYPESLEYVSCAPGEFATKIDIQGDGKFVVAPGSPHESGRRYAVDKDLPLAELPEFVVEWFRARGAKRPTTQTYEGDVDGPARESVRAQFADYLVNRAPLRGAGGVRGEGDKTLWKVVQHGAYDLKLPTADVLELLEEHYDPRCNPPWGPELPALVEHKCRFAKTKSTRAGGSMTEEEFATWSQATGGSKSDLEGEEGVDVPPKPKTPPSPTSAAATPQKPPPKRTLKEKIRWGGWAAEPPEVKYLVDGLLIQNKVAMIYAEPGGIKTWTALDLALSVATGAHWLGQRKVSQCPVLFMDYEDGEYEFWRRVRLLTQGMTQEARDAVDLGYSYMPGKLTEPLFWSEIEQLYVAQPFGFLLIDTLRAANGGVDENDVNAAKMLDFAGAFTETFKDAAMPPTVLTVHHANKTGGIRGTSAFKGAVDVVFKLETEEDNEKRHRATLICDKSGQKKSAPIRLELTDAGLRTWEPDDSPESGGGGRLKELTDDEIQSKILLILQGQGVVASKRKLRDLVKANASRVDTELAELVASGQVAKTKDGFVLDSDQRRRERVFASVRAFDYWASEAELAKDAGVPTEFVHDLRRRGVISRRSSDCDVLGFVVLKP
jgi:hypothetical protein